MADLGPPLRRSNPPAQSSSQPPVGYRDREADFNPIVCEGASSADVILHIYQCDQWTGFLNRWLLKGQDIPIYHLGVEVHGEEWSFLYFEDTWDDDSVSGVIRCQPKCMADYEYLESVNLGPTPLSVDEVDELLVRLHYDYPACTYHLTRRNCLTFAAELTGLLRPPNPFPATFKGILDAANQTPTIDATVDYGWSWAKWYMLRKHSQAEEGNGGDGSSGYLCCAAGGSDRQESMWSLLHPGYTCSGRMCPAGSTIAKHRMDGLDDDILRAPEPPRREQTFSNEFQVNDARRANTNTH